MNTIGNIIKENQELIAYLMRTHMSSYSIMTPMTTMRAHEGILHSEASGPINEQQRISLDTIINNTERLADHLMVFVIATRLIFDRERIYETTCNMSEILGISINEIRKSTDFRIDTINLSENIPEFKADSSLIHQAINCIWRIIKQIHPTTKGQLKIKTENDDSLVKITFSTNMDKPIHPSNENPDLFITQSVAKLHDGEFIVDINDKSVSLIFTLSMKTLS